MQKIIDLIISLTGAKNAEGAFRRLGNVVKTVMGSYATREIYKVTKGMIELGAKAEGIRKSFDNLRGVNLSQLRNAVRGTVSDLTLMQNAVKAEKLGIPVEQLATMFEFASLRARETGEDVEYLTESIVVGLGRQSVLVIDNLGISAVRVREAMKETGDFAKAVAQIVKTDMANMPKNISPAADAADRLGASFENVRLKVAELSTGPAAVGLDKLANLVNSIDGMDISNLINLADKLTPWWIPYIIGTDEVIANMRLAASESQVMADVHDKINAKMRAQKEVVDPLEDAYAKWAIEQINARKETEKLAQWTERLNRELGIFPEKIRAASKIIVKEYDRIIVKSEEAPIALMEANEEFKESFTYFTQENALQWSAMLSSMFYDWKGTLQRMVEELAARAAIFSIFNILTSGAFGWGGILKGIIPGMQHGGSFTIPDQKFQHGGAFTVPASRGGVDSQFVGFRATPGEKVSVSPPGDTGVITINVQGNIMSDDAWLNNRFIPSITRALGRYR